MATKKPPVGKGKTAPQNRGAQPSKRDGTSASADERQAFARAVEGAVPLGTRDRLRVLRAEQSRRVPAATVAGMSLTKGEDGRLAAYRRGGDPSLPRSLSKRSVQAEAEIDLHGMTALEAARAVTHFISNEQRRGRHTVLIIHGKGLHSEDGLGVLQQKVAETLMAPPVAHCVLAFASAHERLGGRGALVVRLSSQPKRQ